MNQTFAYVLQGVGAVIGLGILLGLFYWAYSIFKDAKSREGRQ